MSDGSDMEKTEDPTPQRRDEARKEGRVPKSQDFTAATLILGSALVLNATGPALGTLLLDTFGYGLSAVGAGDLDAASAVTLVQTLGWKVLAVLGVTLASLAAVALAVTGLQARGTFSTKPLGPDWNRINPGANAKRIAGKQAWVDLGKSLVKLAIVGLAVRSSLQRAWPDVLALVQESPYGLLVVVRRYSVSLFTTAGLSYLGLAGLDYFWQLWEHEKSLKMTKEEVKQESKSSEGNPMVKQRMRAVGRAMVRKRMMQDVPRADVVVVNPVHIAVALKYDALLAPAPVVLAVGQRKVAERIKALAYEHGIPVIENRPLARALVAAKVQPGTVIPADLYVAVAEVLAFVFRQRAARGSWSGSAYA
jgi:flagellar biosynthetic protein FlhB